MKLMKLLLASLCLLPSMASARGHVPIYNETLFPQTHYVVYAQGSPQWHGGIACSDDDAIYFTDGRRMVYDGHLLPVSNVNRRQWNCIADSGATPPPEYRALGFYAAGLSADAASTVLGIVLCHAREANPFGAVLSVWSWRTRKREILDGDWYSQRIAADKARVAGALHTAAALHNVAMCF